MDKYFFPLNDIVILPKGPCWDWRISNNPQQSDAETFYRFKCQISNTCRQRDKGAFKGDIKYFLLPRSKCWTPGHCCDSTYPLNHQSQFQKAGNLVFLGWKNENMWLCRKSRRPEAGKTLYCHHALISFLREKHWNSKKRKIYSNLAGKRMMNKHKGRREGPLGEEWKEGWYQDPVERGGIWKHVRRARQHQWDEKREQRWRRLWEFELRARGILGKKKFVSHWHKTLYMIW